jgi:hypothetical protein
MVSTRLSASHPIPSHPIITQPISSRLVSSHLRYIVLDPSEATIRWYKTVDAVVAQGTLDLAADDAEVTLVAAADGAVDSVPQMCIFAGERRLVLKAESEKVVDEWWRAVEAVLAKAREAPTKQAAPPAREARGGCCLQVNPQLESNETN